MSAVLKLEHEPLKSLTEVQSEIENAPDPICDQCGQYLDASWPDGTLCPDCQEANIKRLRKQDEETYGVVDPTDYRMGRGMPKG